MRPFSQGTDHGNPKVEAARFSSFQLGKTGSDQTPRKEGLPGVINAAVSSAQRCCPKRSWRRRRSLSLTKWMIFVTTFLHPCEKKISGLVFKAIPYLSFLDSFGLSCLQQPLETSLLWTPRCTVGPARSELLRAKGSVLINCLLIPWLDSLEVFVYFWKEWDGMETSYRNAVTELPHKGANSFPCKGLGLFLKGGERTGNSDSSTNFFNKTVI